MFLSLSKCLTMNVENVSETASLNEGRGERDRVLGGNVAKNDIVDTRHEKKRQGDVIKKSRGKCKRRRER